MSFGLAAQTFQRFMDNIPRGLAFYFAYLDDILVFFRSLEEHEITFLCYKVSVEGSRLLEERVAHLLDCPVPKTASQLRRFLGLLNLYRRFIVHSAATQAPLHDALSGPRVKGSQSITWTPDLHKAFEECKATRRACHAQLYWHTPTQLRHLHSSQTLPLPPWVLCNVSTTLGSPSPSSPIS
jgi:hypothetical protein